MWANIGSAWHRGRQYQRPEVIEEDERSDHPPLRRRQDPADMKSTEIALARGNLDFYRCSGIGRFVHVLIAAYFFCAACSRNFFSWFIHSVQSCGPWVQRFCRLASTLPHARSK